MRLTVRDLAQMIDLSAVHTEHNEADVRRLVAYARQYDCIAVYTLPDFVPLARELLADAPHIAVGGAVGFPSGGVTTATKVAEAKELVTLGCRELDMVINVGMLRSGHHQRVHDDIRAVVAAGGGLPVKVILECHYLSDDEIRRGCELAMAAGAAFMKTGTGWAPTGATLENVALIRSVVGGRMKIKAAGGVRGLETMKEMYRRGATRFGIGMSSAVRILEQAAGLPGAALEWDTAA